MKVTEIERKYSFEVTVKQYKKILARDEREEERDRPVYHETGLGTGGYTTVPKGTISGRLLSIEHVKSIEHDAFLGPCIWITIEQPCQLNTLDIIQKTIANYAK